MSSAARGTALVVAVIVVGGLAWWLLGGSGSPRVPEEPLPPRLAPESGYTGQGTEPAPPPDAGTGPAEPAKGPLLRGRVTDRLGKPVAGAAVEARPPAAAALPDLRLVGEALFEPRPPRAAASSGADGSFALAGLPAGTWTLTASAAGHGPARAEGIVVDRSTEAPPVELVLGPAHRLLVRVLDGGGAPVRGAEVLASRAGNSPWIPVGEVQARGSTDPAGEARLEGLGTGRAFVVVRTGPGRVAGREVRIPEDREVEIRAGGTAALVVRVSVEGGGPVEGAAVAAVVVAPGSPAATVVRGPSGPDGAARFEGLAPGTVALLSVEKAGHAPASLGGPGAARPLHDEFSTLREDATLELEVRLLPGAVLAGTVRRQDTGAPVPRARVTVILPMLLVFGGRRTAESDESGDYRLDGLPGGRALAYAHAEGAATAGALPGGASARLLTGRGEPSPLTVEIRDGPAETRHDLVVEATGSVAGRVLGPDGAPAAGARVSVRAQRGGGDLSGSGEDLPPAAVLATADGTFRVEGVPRAGGLVAAAALAGRVPGVSSPFTVEAGAPVEGIEIRLLAGGVVLGRVTGPDGVPVPGAQVGVAPQGGATRDGATDALGNFRIDAIPAGTASLTVAAEGFVRRIVPSLTVSDGEEARTDLALEAGLEIRGRVLDAAGTPVSGARVSARNVDRQPASGVRTASATTESDGSFRVTGLPAGTWNLSVSPANHPRTTIPSVVSGGPPVEVRLPPAVRISGRVTDLSGNPLAGVRVDASPSLEGGAGGGAGSGADGTFEIRNLVAGSYRLDVRPRAGWGEKRIEGIEGGSTGLEIRLEKSLTISGRVLGPDGNPAAGRGRIRVLDAAGNQVASARWDSRGEFQAGGIREGTYSLQVRVEGPTVLVASASAAAGAEGVVLRLQPE